MSNWYLNWVEGQGSPRERYVQKLLSNLPAKPNILELGCGAGTPVLRMLLDHGASVVGNDISSKQIELAKTRCPEAELIAGDMAGLSFADEKFDGVAAFYALFHLPREEYKTFLGKIHAWMKPGGYFVFNLATVDQEDIHGEFFGHGMYWSSYGQDENLKILREAGFEVLEKEVLEAGDGNLKEGDPDYGVKFMWILAKKV